MERRAQAAEQLAARSKGQDALDYLIKAAEFYMKATAETQDKAHITQLRRNITDILARGEVLKAEIAEAAKPEAERIISQGSSLHGNEFPPWKGKPLEEEFETANGGLFTDDAVYTMSTAQNAILEGWQRPAQRDTSLLMDSSKGCDLVQDVTTDCSVVASLSAALNILTGKRKMLSSIMYPSQNGLPQVSPSGKYVLKMHFNGCPRRVVVDDRLPVSQTDRTLFVVDRRNPHLIWPAILEKAYLKVRGGYDFPGSNSGTDLWVITGWIPEQVFLQKEDLDVSEMWRRIKTAWDFEDVAITLGTGRMGEEEERVSGLIGEHDYAVVGLDERDGVRQLLLKNPWCNGPTWAGPDSLAPSSSSSSHTNTSLGVWSQPKDASSGLQAMTLEDVVQNFESLYLNWNPKLFQHRQDHHFSWTLPKGALSASLVCNPQYTITPTAQGRIWVLVSRHFTDAELEIARQKPDSLGFMSILIFDTAGKRVQVGDGELYASPYVDSPQTLARVDAKKGVTYTVVIDQHELPLPSYTFSMSVFSQTPVQVAEAKEEALPHQTSLSGSWKRRSAGGSAASPAFGTNPQYALTITHPTTTALSLLLATDAPDIPVHIDLLWSSGHRVHDIKVRDLVTSSGSYRRGCAVASAPTVEPGTYTLVLSTFEPSQLADFTLLTRSSHPITLQPIPAAGAGRLKIPLPPTTFLAGQHRLRAPISIPWLTRASITLFSSSSNPSLRAPYAIRASSGLMIRLSIVFGWEPNASVVADTGEGFMDVAASTLRTGEFDLEPERGVREGCWCVVESMGNHAVETPVVEGEVMCDAPVRVGAWEVAP